MQFLLIFNFFTRDVLYKSLGFYYRFRLENRSFKTFERSFVTFITATPSEKTCNF